MRALSCVLAREGVSDEWFLAPLLRRAMEQLCAEEFDGIVEVLPVLCLGADTQQPAKVIEAAEDVRGAFDVLLFHRDGAPPAKSEEVVRRMREAWRDCAATEPLVAVVPLRETEAWALADLDALRRVLGLSPAKVAEFAAGLRGTVDQLQNPKEELGRLATRIGRSDLEAFLGRLAEQIEIGRLRKLPAFACWWTDMTNALENLGFRYG